MDLPKALESILGALLSNHFIVSWKVTADGQNPTVVLRMQPDHEFQDVGKHGRPIDSITGGWHKKGPARVRRDRERWQAHQQRINSDANRTRETEAFVSSVETKADKMCQSDGECVLTETVAGERRRGVVSRDQNKGVTVSHVNQVVQSIHTDLSGGAREGRDSVETLENVVTEEIRANYTCGDRQYTRPTLTGPTHLQSDPQPQSLLSSAPVTSEAGVTREPRQAPTHTDSEVAAAECSWATETETRDFDTGSEMGSEMGSENEQTGVDHTSMEEDSSDRVIKSKQTPREMVDRESEYLALWKLDTIMKENRNTDFKKVVLDRRGRGVPRLVCFSTDLVLICDTGTLERYFYIMKIPCGAGFRGHGDELAECCKTWPDIDRGGEYKQMIDALKTELPMYMDHIRCVFTERYERGKANKPKDYF